jgi:hypothetical protein
MVRVIFMRIRTYLPREHNILQPDVCLNLLGNGSKYCQSISYQKQPEDDPWQQMMDMP